MKILDLYILKKYIGAFLFVVFCLVAIICIIDYAEKNEDYMQASLTFGEVFMGYYIHMIPYLVNFLSPITVFVSTILITAQLASHTEIIAILSSGVSFIRFIASYVMGAIFLGVIVFFLLGWVIPKSNQKRVDFEIQYLDKKTNFDRKNIHLRLAPELYAYIESYNHSANMGYQFSLEKMNGKEVVEKLTANKIAWDTTKNKWHIYKYENRIFKDGKEEIVTSKGVDTTLNLFPKDLMNIAKRHQTLTIPELNAFIKEQKVRGLEDVRVYMIEKYERMTYPLAIIILTVMAVIVSARKSREGVGLQILMGLVLAMIYILFVMTARSFAQGDGGIHPLLAALLPNIVFTIVSIVLYRTVPR